MRNGFEGGHELVVFSFIPFELFILCSKERSYSILYAASLVPICEMCHYMCSMFTVVLPEQRVSLMSPDMNDRDGWNDHLKRPSGNSTITARRIKTVSAMPLGEDGRLLHVDWLLGNHKQLTDMQTTDSRSTELECPPCAGRHIGTGLAMC